MTSQPVSLLPLTPHDLPDDSSLKSESAESCFDSEGDVRLEPHGSNIISATRPIALALPRGVITLAHIERSKSLNVRFMKGRGSRP